MVMTEAKAEEILRADLAKFEERASRLVKVPLTDNQHAVLVSFDFNTGKLHSSALLKKLNQGDYGAVPAELMKWVNAGGKRVKGLLNRRSAEAGLWAKGEFVSSNTVPAAPRAPDVVGVNTMALVLRVPLEPHTATGTCRARCRHLEPAPLPAPWRRRLCYTAPNRRHCRSGQASGWRHARRRESTRLRGGCIDHALRSRSGLAERLREIGRVPPLPPYRSGSCRRRRPRTFASFQAHRRHAA